MSEEGLNKKILFQSSTAEFLANHNFDFNKLFYEGIPCISKQEQLQIQQSKSTMGTKSDFFSNQILGSKEYQAFKSRYFQSVTDSVEKFRSLNLEVMNSDEHESTSNESQTIQIFIKHTKHRV